MVDSEQKAWARGIWKVVTSFVFICTLYFLSDVMSQLTIFLKTVQAVDIGVDGIMATYRTTQGILMGYKKDISELPFTCALSLEISIWLFCVKKMRKRIGCASRRKSPRGTSKCMPRS